MTYHPRTFAAAGERRGRRLPTDARRAIVIGVCARPAGSSTRFRRRAWLLVLGSAALLAVLLAVPRDKGPQPVVVTRGGLIEVEYTTASTDLQRAAGRRCGLDAVANLSPTHIRYAVPPGQERRAGDCPQRQGIVRAVAILG